MFITVQKEGSPVQKIAIITDTCADIPSSFIEENDIFILPLIIRVGETEYRADVDISPAEIYDVLKTEIPKTSLPSVDQALTLLESLVEQGYTHAIAIMLSGGLSGTANMLRVLGEQVSGLELSVWDSLSGSIGCGLPVIQAAEAVKEGKSFEEINELVPTLLKNTHVFFSVDTLEYLQKGGRIGRITAIAGTALQIKPILGFAPDGQLGSVAKVRGKKLVQSRLCELVGEHLTPGCRYNLVVGDGGDPEGGAQLRAKLEEMFPDAERCIYINIDATLSCYIGPGVLGAGIQIIE